MFEVTRHKSSIKHDEVKADQSAETMHAWSRGLIYNPEQITLIITLRCEAFLSDTRDNNYAS